MTCLKDHLYHPSPFSRGERPNRLMTPHEELRTSHHNPKALDESISIRTYVRVISPAQAGTGWR